MRIGILGGTFDPVHIGHLLMASVARDTFRLGKVLFVPCADPPHKKVAKPSDARIRFHMLQRAVAGNPAFAVSDVELRRGGRSYSYDTLRELKKTAKSSDQFFFIIGKDSLEQILSWYRVRDLMELCSFIVVDRPGASKHSTRELLKKLPLYARRCLGRHLLNDFPIGVSSRQIRERIGKGQPIRYLVSEPVEAFLNQTGLYKKKHKALPKT